MIGNQAEIRVKTGAVYENIGSLTSSLNNQGYNIDIHQTAILMKQANVVAIRPRKCHYCPDAG
jgi:hypothetical protein